MFDADHDDLALIVPTRNRKDSLYRLVESQQKYAPHLSIHAIRHSSDEYDHPHVTMWESDAFPIGKCYRAVVAEISADAYLFCDDDHSLTENFSVATLREALNDYPAWSLPVHTDEDERIIRDAAKCGGQVVTATAYSDAGQHGDDYLEDIELSLRLSWAGYPPKRYPEKLTIHHTGTDGGLRSAHPDVPEKATAYESLSRLAERYERVEKSEASYYGYREVC